MIKSHFTHFPKLHLLAISLTLITVVIAVSYFEVPTQRKQVKQVSIEQVVKPEAKPAFEPPKWEQDKVKSGDNLSTIFTRNELSAVDVLAIAKAAPRGTLNLQPGQTVEWQTYGDSHVQVMKIIMSPLASHVFQHTGEGVYQYKLEEKEPDHRARFAQATIESALFIDGAQANIPDQVLLQLASIFGWDIDFALDIRKGDSFSLIYDELYLEGKLIGYGDIHVARFNNQGRELTAIRHEDKHGDEHYYSPTGANMRKAFLRNPLDVFRISSHFNLRRKHPVLNKIRAHKGTDYAAPRGTPIKSIGDGKVTFAGRKGGYGNVVILQHGSRYETRYAHLSKFHRSTRRGRKVKQGQIIGYVGSSGLATGPHLHFEFRMDGVHRNPLRVKTPKSKPIPKEYKTEFLQQANRMVAWLESYTPANIADSSEVETDKTNL